MKPLSSYPILHHFITQVVTCYMSTKNYRSIFDELSAYRFVSICACGKHNIKFFYAFARDEYNVGFVDPCGFSMISTTINTKAPSNETIHIKKFQKTSLETLEERVALQQTLREQKHRLEQELARLRAYILRNYTLEMLL